VHKLGNYDTYRVAAFLEILVRQVDAQDVIRVLDQRIHESPDLSVADKVEVVQRLSARGEEPDLHWQLCLERIICSLSADQLPLFKFALDYDGDYRDLEQYVFHDISDTASRMRIIDHLTTVQEATVGLKVLSDVDDTIYANLADKRYPKKTLYPGVLELYDAIKREPFALNWIPVTTLTARPNPVGGTMEESGIRAIKEHTHGRLRPSALSGHFWSSTLGTIETLVRERREEVREGSNDTMNRLVDFATQLFDFEEHEKEIGLVKFLNFQQYADLYPEYRFVFFGDSGQADITTSEQMLTHQGLSRRVIAAFIHDLGAASSSPCFNQRNRQLQIGPNSSPEPGMILFRNYIQAAVCAYRYCDGLISATALARVTQAALREFLWIDFHDMQSRAVLLDEYSTDAEDVAKLLDTVAGGIHMYDAAAIRDQLSRNFQGDVW